MKIIDIPRSGSYASNTSSRNRGGQYVRNRRAPVQPIGSGRRAKIRTALSNASNGWSALSDSDRAAWEAFAASNPVSDALGQSIKLTGHQWFVSCGTQLLNLDQGLPTAPPGSTTVPHLTGITASAVASTGVVTVSWTTDGATGDFIMVAASPQMSAGRSYNKQFNQLAHVPGDTATKVLTAEYAAEFGVPVAGKRIFFRLTTANEFGFTGAQTIVSCIVS
jgi:hypothetical protein